ncbi:MAG TPA: FGGY-family carbohydrate kinase, partial [Puia sp.]|nr:FGGY-family carbohydrate kinase [Puia sp.]
EQADAFAGTTDEEGEACEDVETLRNWVFKAIALLDDLNEFDIRAINFSAYGASFVHVGDDGVPVAPLYNYLKPFPDGLRKKFYDSYGGEVTFSMLTASPVLGSLNSGMQLYRIKEQQPELFAQIKYSLHLPQYLSFLCAGVACSDITSIGCHTNLWNFSQQHYHEWVYREGIIDKLAPVLPSTSVLPFEQPVGTILSRIPIAGIGLHDSSAAIIPYLQSFREPFILISTGTWCISMNPFNDSPLTVAELQKDCLCYLSYQGRPVKASRLFAGYEHEQQVKRMAAHFHTDAAVATTLPFDPECAALLRKSDGRKSDGRPSQRGASGPTEKGAGGPASATVVASAFGRRDLNAFDSFPQAYHCLMMDIMDQQIASTRLIMQDRGVPVNRIFVDGGFGKNQVYMHLLAAAFPEMEVFAASMPQATAIGAALAIHPHWNTRSLPGDIIELKYYI